MRHLNPKYTTARRVLAMGCVGTGLQYSVNFYEQWNTGVCSGIVNQ
jgi:hypothetical protein